MATIFSKTETEKQQQKLANINDDLVKTKIVIDSKTIDRMFGVLFLMEDERVGYNTIVSFHKLFCNMDMSIYENDVNCKKYADKVYILMDVLDEICSRRHKLMSPDDLDIYIHENYTDDKFTKLIPTLTKYIKKPLSHSELSTTINSVVDRLNYIYLVTYKQEIMNAYSKLESGEYNCYRAANEALQLVLSSLMTKMRQNRSTDSSIKEMNLAASNFNEVLISLVKKLRDNSRILMTGNKRLNMLLSPGFVGGNLYIFAGLPNAGKTTILTKCALDICKYNHNVTVKNPDKKPTVLMITAEDTMEKMAQRIINNRLEDIDIKDESLTVEEIVDMAINKGGLNAETGNNLYIKYCKNQEIDTNDIYSLVEELDSDGYEVIAVVVDYIKRIKPIVYAKEERDQLKNISNDLRALSIDYDIPVITAAQMNREGSAAVEQAIAKGESDVLKRMGKNNIGSSWALQENTDMMIAINTEIDNLNNQKYMSFLKMKIRYKDEYGLLYFATPYSKDGGRLLDDYDMAEGQYVSTISIAGRAIVHPTRETYEESGKNSEGIEDECFFTTDLDYEKEEDSCFSNANKVSHKVIKFIPTTTRWVS